MAKDPQHQEDGVDLSSANAATSRYWETCPRCERGGTPSPRFDKFIPWIHHMVEHETGGLRPGYTPLHPPDDLDWFYEQTGQPRRRLTAQKVDRILTKAARKYLPAISEWLEASLATSPELASIQEAGILTAERLSKIVRSLAADQEEREYLIEHEERLKETGQDPKWPRTSGSQAKFVSQSMAGAAWGLTPTTSREYVRRAKPRERVFKDKRKSYERRPRTKDGRMRTSRNYDGERSHPAEDADL